MVTIVNNPKGSTRGYFSRVEEYAIYCFMPKATICFGNDPMLGETTSSKKPRWKGLLRSGEGARREDSKNLFYPVLIDPIKKKIVKAGAVVPFPEEPPYGEKLKVMKLLGLFEMICQRVDGCSVWKPLTICSLKDIYRWGGMIPREKHGVFRI